MAPALSKIALSAPNPCSCMSFVHPWTDSCMQATCGLYLYCIFDSMRIYGSVYVLALLMKGRIPTKDDIRKTLYGVLQSTAFLSFTGFGYSLFLCTLRRLLGHFNLLTVSGIPAFLASVFAIAIERPSRRTLLCLYVSNVATETVWNMMLSRNMVQNVRYGNVALFGGGIALLLMYLKNGNTAVGGGPEDSMFRVLRFVVGSYEDKAHLVQQRNPPEAFYRQHEQHQDNTINRRASARWRTPHKNPFLALIYRCLSIYKRLIERVKCAGRHPICPHPFSCLYYCLEGGSKMFSIGLGIQLTLKLLLNARKVAQRPSSVGQIVWRKDNLNLGAFLGAFSGLFRASLCVLRRCTGKDDPAHALPAGLLAGMAFTRYPDNTVALYVLWKAAQVTYNIGIERKIVPKVPYFTEFLYCFSTAILFHAAILEPTNLRPSYWKFLHSISGGRIACMAREPLDVWGLNTTESLQKVLAATKTKAIVHF